MANRKRPVSTEEPKTLIADGFYKGDVWVKERRHLLFATEKQLELLSKAKSWYIDATFHVVKPPFTQLFSVMQCSKHLLPCTFCAKKSYCTLQSLNHGWTCLLIGLPIKAKIRVGRNATY